ncbi:GTP pyrophosphokinase [Agreia bicolorata]|uniref:RelA/SpoT domain-containing protein n=1 Tax=Agreia bicolorata TaxID=110935 RepID=A0ABR5CB91_9MICO|nr:RelA/SpoT domain-containing protein [Agreia bicolorata]KJC62897.1 hypothetical protein TZ00_17955 [Agreia bicolorata]
MADDSNISAAELYIGYAAQEETYRNASEEYLTRLQAVLIEADIQAALLEARHKKPLELFKKQRRKNYANPWSDCPDLVGVRIVVPLTTDKARVVHAVRGALAFESVEVEDQSVGANPQEIAYRGLHIHLTSDQVNEDGLKIRCELQVRTVAEHSWAMTEHKYVYKKVPHLPYEVERTFRRLLVLVELYDLELSRGVDLVKSEPAFAEMSLVLHLEELFEGMTGRVGDQETTREIVALLAASLGASCETLRSKLDAFLKSKRDVVEQFFLEHGPESDRFEVDSDWFVTQPEVLLILALLEEDEYELSNALSSSDAYQYVEPIALWTDHPGFLR